MKLGTWTRTAAIAVVTVLATGGIAHADTITVNQTGDPSDGSCPEVCSLRHAVAAAGDADTVALAGATYTLRLGSPITISRPVTIQGASMKATRIDGAENRDADDHLNRLFTVDGGDLRLNDLTLAGGRAEADETCLFGCWTLAATGGGALLNLAGSTSELTNVELVDNWARVGGAIASAGTLNLTGVDFHADDAAFGGGLFVRGGTATVQRSALHGLGASSFGGGAAFVFAGALTLRDATVAGNGSGNTPGGGIENYGGTLALVNATLAGNVRGALMTDQGATTSAQNTIVGAGVATQGDWACVPVGEATGSDTFTDRGITIDLGHNLDEDGHCLLDPDTNLANVDPRLAPLGDNGGPAPTFALLHGSPALDAADDQCSLFDQRGIARPQGLGCDIGAFEAIRAAAPAAVPQPATGITMTGATLHADVDLGGEAGAVHFLLGPTADALKPTASVSAGQSGPVSLDVGGLAPHTTYVFSVEAENATGTSASAAPLSFTTADAPPAVTAVTVDAVDDTTAKLSFSIDPGGAATRYVVQYGADDTYGETTPSVAVGSSTQVQRLTTTLLDLDPGTSYHFRIVATNVAAPDGVAGTDNQFTTDQQQSATAKQPLKLTTDGSAENCPQAAIDWGDGTPSEAGAVVCTPLGEHGSHYEVSATHTYATAGHYRLTVDYGASRREVQWALVAPPPAHSLVITFAGSGSGTVAGGGLRCTAACSGVFEHGTPVALTATPAAGSRFAGWDGACTGTAGCALVLDARRDVSARFALLPPALTDLRVDSSDVAATVAFTLDAGGADTSYSIQYGTDSTYGHTVEGTLAAGSGARRVTRTIAGLEPHTPYHFIVRASSAAAPDGVDSGDQVFTTDPRHVGLSVGVSGSGSVTGAGIDCPGDCAESYRPGTAVTLTAHPAGGARFTGWSGDCAGTGGCTVTLDSARSVTATFGPAPQGAVATPTPARAVTAVPTAVFRQRVVLRTVTGSAKFRLKGAKGWTALTGPAAVPFGSQVDARRGKVSVSAVAKAGAAATTATASGGVFTLGQSGATIDLALSGTTPACSGRAKPAGQRELWAEASGAFRISGRFAAATGRGARWLVQDTCAGTTVRVTRGKAAVTDKARGRTMSLSAGRSYLARSRRR